VRERERARAIAYELEEAEVVHKELRVEFRLEPELLDVVIGGPLTRKAVLVELERFLECERERERERVRGVVLIP